MAPARNTRRPSVSVSRRTRSMGVPSGNGLGAAGCSGSGITRLGSVGISATGTSSATWWKAQRFQGERRQLASVTVSVVSMMLLFRLGDELQGIALGLGHVGGAGRLGLGDVLREDSDHAEAPCMRRVHHGM